MSKKGHSLERIIPKDTVNLRKESSRFEDSMKELLIPQSGAGHAHEGHSEFKGKKFPNMTIEKYHNISQEDKNAFIQLRKDRQGRINLLKGWRNDTLTYLGNIHNGVGFEKARDKVLFLSSNGIPLCGISHYATQGVYDHKSVIQTTVPGSKLDGEDSRKLVNMRVKKYYQSYLNSHSHIPFGLEARLKWALKHPLRRGVSKAINLERMKEVNLGLEEGHLSLSRLANCSRENKISFLKEMGFADARGKVNLIDFVDALILSGIAQDSSNNYVDQNIVSGYVELTPGIGVSDDAAYLLAALMYGNNASTGLDAATGFNIVDYIDTVDKCSMEITTEGQDGSFGIHVSKHYKKITGQNLTDPRKDLSFIFAARRIKKHFFASSSQRYLWRTAHQGQEYGISEMEILNEFIERTFNGELDKFHPKNISLDFERIPIVKFLNGFMQRWDEVREECQKTGLFDIKYFPDYFGKYKK